METTISNHKKTFLAVVFTAEPPVPGRIYNLMFPRGTKNRHFIKNKYIIKRTIFYNTCNTRKASLNYL